MSGIYIPGMEMPTRCEECPCFYPEYNECNAIVGRWVDGKGTPPSDCPLVPVPDHGRLGDLDALEVHTKKLYTAAFADGNSSFHFAYRSLSKVIANAPTIIPASKEGEG